MIEIFQHIRLSSNDIPDLRVVLTVYGLGLLEWFFFFNETFPGIKYYFFFAENDTVWADIARFACVITFPLLHVLHNVPMGILLYTIHLFSHLASLEFILSF